MISHHTIDARGPEYIHSLLFCDLRCTNSAAFWAALPITTFGNHVCIIVGNRPKKQVATFNAGPVVAMMANAHTFWYWPIRHNPSHSVGVFDPFARPYSTVSCRAFRARPLQAIGGSIARGIVGKSQRRRPVTRAVKLPTISVSHGALLSAAEVRAEVRAASAYLGPLTLPNRAHRIYQTQPQVAVNFCGFALRHRRKSNLDFGVIA
jgi:hypothetical protein